MLSRNFTPLDCRRLRTPSTSVAAKAMWSRRLARAHQMHGGGAARIKPVAREVERRPFAVLQPQHVAIEILGTLQIRGFDGVMLQSAEWHGFLLLDEGEIGVGAHHPGANGFKMPELA